MEDINTYEEGFKIDSDSLAEWALNKIKDAEAERDRLNAVSSEKIAFYTNNIEDNNRRCEHETSFLKGCLRAYFESVPHKETKTQETYKLPSGTLTWKKPKMDYERNDEELLKYMKETHPEFVVTKESIDWAEFKKNIAVIDGTAVDTENGVVIMAITPIVKDGSFDVKM